MYTATNFIGALNAVKQSNLKPDFSDLESVCGVNGHTLKKYYDNLEIKRKSYVKANGIL